MEYIAAIVAIAAAIFGVRSVYVTRLFLNQIRREPRARNLDRRSVAPVLSLGTGKPCNLCPVGKHPHIIVTVLSMN